MAIELRDGEVEVKRIPESKIGWVEYDHRLEGDVGLGRAAETLKLKRRDHPVKDGQRWILDTATDEWVLCERRGKKK